MDTATSLPSPAAVSAAGCWSFDPADAAAATRAAVRAAVSELGVISATGEDAARFLHGQLTNDVEKLAADQVALNGYCSAKGRLLATFRIWRDADGVHLLVPKDVLPGVLKRLSMFVLRAKVKLVDASERWRVWAVFGADAAAAVGSVAPMVPAATGQAVAMRNARLGRLHPGASVAERYLLIAPAADEPALLDALATVPTVGSGAFWWSEIDAGVPTVFAATQERFVPQMINFEVIGGVSFSKGCYPGQEVVARSQYRGKLRRRMQLAHCAATPAAGADVYAEGEAEAVGTVVMAASAPDGGYDLLFECPLEKAESPLRLGASEGPPLALRSLPYELVDVTA